MPRFWGKSGAKPVLRPIFGIGFPYAGIREPYPTIEGRNQMAWFEFDQKSGIYRVRFRFPSDSPQKHRVPKEYKLRDEGEAHAKYVEIDETTRLVERGILK